MKIQYELVFADMIEANRAHGRNNLKKNWIILGFVVLLAIIFLYRVFSGTHIQTKIIQSSQSEEITVVEILKNWVPVLIILFLWFFLQKYSIKKQWKDNLNLHHPIECTIDEQGYAISSKTYNALIAWSGFLKFVETENLFILYVSKYLYHVVPKRSLNEEQISSLKEMLKEKIGNIAPCR